MPALQYDLRNRGVIGLHQLVAATVPHGQSFDLHQRIIASFRCSGIRSVERDVLEPVIFEELKGRKGKPESFLKEMLVEKAGRKNYIPDSARGECG